MWEAEELRNSTRAMETRLKVAESKSLSEASKRVEAERQLASAQQKIEELEALAAEAATLPALRADLAKAKSQIQSLTQSRDSLQVAPRTLFVGRNMESLLAAARVPYRHRLLSKNAHCGTQRKFIKYQIRG